MENLKGVKVTRGSLAKMKKSRSNGGIQKPRDNEESTSTRVESRLEKNGWRL